MEFDDTPTGVLVNSVIMGPRYCKMLATDKNGVWWYITLDMGEYGGAKRWFAETVSSRVANAGSFLLMSQYDSDRDEWFTRAGNYGIYSRDLQFAEAK